MKPILLLALLFLIACNGNDDNPIQEKCSKNIDQFDSLVLILRSDTPFINKMVNDFYQTDSTELDSNQIMIEAYKTDSLQDYWDDILNMEYCSFLEKHQMDKEDEKAFLMAISVTASLIKMERKFKQIFENIDSRQHSLFDSSRSYEFNKIEPIGYVRDSAGVKTVVYDSTTEWKEYQP